MAKFEIEKRVRTADGVVHDSREAAHAHMRRRSLCMLAQADDEELARAVDHSEIWSEDTLALREAIRDVYLMAWPRQRKGGEAPQPPAAEAPPSTATQPEPLVEEPGTSDPSPPVEHQEPPADHHEGAVVELAPMAESAHEAAHAPRSRKKA